MGDCTGFGAVSGTHNVLRRKRYEAKQSLEPSWKTCCAAREALRADISISLLSPLLPFHMVCLSSGPLRISCLPGGPSNLHLHILICPASGAVHFGPDAVLGSLYRSCLGLASPSRGRFGAAFKCNQPADTPCLVAGKHVIYTTIMMMMSDSNAATEGGAAEL